MKFKRLKNRDCTAVIRIPPHLKARAAEELGDGNFTLAVIRTLNKALLELEDRPRTTTLKEKL